LNLTKKEIVKIDTVSFDNYLLPPNNNYLSWGKMIVRTKNLNTDIMVINGNKYNYSINTIDGINYSITLFNRLNPNKNLITLTDHKCLGFADEGYFIRKINNYFFYVDNNNNKILLVTKKLETKFLETLKIKPLSKPKIITIDIETIVKNGIHKPYLFSLFDGKNKFSWFDNNADDLFKCLLKRKYKNYSVYAHNLSKFDIIFLHKNIAKLNKDYKISFLKRDDKYISITISNLTNNIKISIKDSYNLLPSSLNDLSTQFNIENPKTIEPIFQGDPNSVYYQSDISHYNKKVNILYNLDDWKKEIKNYCETDCIALYQILIKFRQLIYENFKVNIDKYPTIPSVAFAIFRTHYMKENSIPLIKGREAKIFDFIHDSFTGGSTEMYIPYAGEAQNIKCYDVNALYPSSMKFNKFPTGNILQFQGNIEWLYKLDPNYSKDNSYWIGDAFVETKVDLHKPYLQVNHLTRDHGLIGKRTISANGSFNMKINSPEYYNALKDYNIQINCGFLFESDDIFSKYVENLYSLRQQYNKSDPMNYILKLLLNSLYGRFAMKPITTITKYISRDENIFNFLEKFEIHDYIEIDNDILLLSYSSKNEEITFEDFKNSISIASAVTAYSRVFMSKFKNNQLYYGDTDSAFIEGELDPTLIGKNLGQFKLEYTFKEIVFFCFARPKIYAGITTDGKYICKIKGYKNSQEIPFELMKSLLNKDSSLSLNHVKWFRNISDSEILMKDQLYELAKSNSKREFIYNNEGIAINTKPFKLLNNFKLEDDSKE
jgi:hypothetical protein